jgi:molybdopterin converting factor small subunit
MIYVKAYADLSRYLNISQIGEKVVFDNKDKDTKIVDIANFFNIPLEKISIVLLNGEYSSLNSIAKNNDTVIFFSPVDGG